MGDVLREEERKRKKRRQKRSGGGRAKKQTDQIELKHNRWAAQRERMGNGWLLPLTGLGKSANRFPRWICFDFFCCFKPTYRNIPSRSMRGSKNRPKITGTAYSYYTARGTDWLRRSLSSSLHRAPALCYAIMF